MAAASGADNNAHSTFAAFRKATGTVRPPGQHGCKPVEVVPGLWTAHYHDIDNLEKLKAAAPPVTVVVNSAPDKCQDVPGFYGPNVEVLVVDLLDDPDPMKKVDAMPDGPEKVAAKAALPVFKPEECAGDAKKDFGLVNATIDGAIASGGAALVHCHASLSRSVAFVLAYIMRTQNITAVEAVAVMKAKWDAVWPNDTFVNQLIEYEKELAANRGD